VLTGHHERRRCAMQITDAWKHAPHCPQLYIYSERDALIPPEHVERFIEAQRKRGRHTHRWRAHAFQQRTMRMHDIALAGVEVVADRWKDSGHCDHLRHDPLRYRHSVEAFLKRCVHE
jgi:hypothetical protein